MTVAVTSATGLQITAKDAFFLTGTHVIFLWANPLAQTRNYYKGPYNHTTDMDFGTSLPLTISAVAVIGQRWHYAYRAFDAANRVSTMTHKYVDCLT